MRHQKSALWLEHKTKAGAAELLIDKIAVGNDISLAPFAELF
jgi:hypothetical protein